MAARGNADIVQMLLNGMMSAQPETPSTEKTLQTTNGRSEGKGIVPSGPSLAKQGKPRYQFAEPQISKNPRAGPPSSGVLLV